VKTKSKKVSRKILSDMAGEDDVDDGHVWEGQGTIGL
jgi:hypothetical protein